MRSLRAIFLRFSISEKTLLVVFALLIVGVWFLSFNRRAWKFKAEARATSSELALQQQWLDNRTTIEEAAKKTADWLGAAKTLDATALNAAVVGMAAEAGLRASTGDQREESTVQFNVHTLVVRIDKAEWGALSKFYLAMQSRSPAIGIEQCTLIPDRATPGLTSATIRVSAPEVVR